MPDCCFEIFDNAAMDVEHGMISKHGRIFAIYDEVGGLVAQSWVWRNGNVICFDNIEVPKKYYDKYNKSTKEAAEEIFNIYKIAGEELIKEDQRYYKMLLDEGKITKETYYKYALHKVLLHSVLIV